MNDKYKFLENENQIVLQKIGKSCFKKRIFKELEEKIEKNGKEAKWMAYKTAFLLLGQFGRQLRKRKALQQSKFSENG